MNALRTSLITTALLAGFTVSATAQMGPAHKAGHEGQEHHAGPRMPGSREHLDERQQQHLARLKEKLQLQAAQEADWKTFVDALKPAASRANARVDRVGLQQLSTPERIDQMQALHAQRDPELKQRGDAIKVFYAALTADQKKTFDNETLRWMAGRRHNAGHHGHGH